MRKSLRKKELREKPIRSRSFSFRVYTSTAKSTSDKIYYVNLGKAAKSLKTKEKAAGKGREPVSKESETRTCNIIVRPGEGLGSNRTCLPLVPSQKWPLSY